MDLSDGYMSMEHRELLRSASESADPLSVSPLELSMSPKTPRSPKSPRSPKGSPKAHSGKHGAGKGSPLKKDKQSHSPFDGRPKKGKFGGLYFILCMSLENSHTKTTKPFQICR